MSLASQLTEAGILLHTNQVQQYDLRYLEQRVMRARRFQKTRIEVSKLLSAAPGVYEARLVFLSLVQPEHLTKALAAHPYRHEGNVYVDWEVLDSGFHDGQEPRIERRRLTNLTTISIPSLDCDPVAGLDKLSHLIQTTKAYSSIDEQNLLEEVGRDLICWATRNLPGPLWAHLLGVQTFWAPPRDTLVRKVTHLRAPRGIVQNTALDIQKATFEDVALETALSRRTGEDTSVIDAALRILTTRDGETDDETLNRWTAGLLQLKTNVQYSDCHTAIIIAWTLNLIESGTANHSTAVPQTRSSYIKLLSLPLLSALRAIGGDPTTWTEEQLTATYTALMISNGSDRRKLSAAINDFQMYCHETWATPFVQTNASTYVPPPRPRTQIVHPHEIQLAVHWLETYQDGDQRLLQISALMLRLFECAPFRLNELAYVRLENIKFNTAKTEAWVEVYPCTENVLKTASATRPLHICDAVVIGKLAAWMDKRRVEGAEDSDFVFGKKLGRGLYRKALANATMRSVLKAATGDPGMTLHALRHSYATRVFAEVLLNEDVIDMNRLTQLAHDMGHVSVSTTIQFYVHDYCDLLWTLSERVTGDSLQFDSTEAERVTGSSSETLRQVPKRKGISVDAYTKEHVRHTAGVLVFPAALDHSSWIPAECPELTGHTLPPLTILKAWEITASFSQGEPSSMEEIANLHDVPLDLVKRAATALQTMGLRTAMKWRSNRRSRFGAITSTAKAIQALQIDPQDLLQQKYAGLLHKMADQVWTSELEDLARVVDLLICDTYIDLTASLASAQLFTFLKRCEVDASQLLITVQGNDDFDRGMLQIVQAITSQFVAVWQTPPNPYRSPRRRDRPDAYLLFRTGSDKDDSKSLDSGGLLTLLHCICLFSILSKQP